MRAALLLLAVAWPLAAGAEPLPVRLIDNASWTFTARHEREIEGAPDKSFSVTTSKRLTWTRVAGQGRLRMEHISVTANSGLPAEAVFTQTLTIPVELEVDAALGPTGVRNPDEVRAAVREMFLKTGATAQNIDQMVAVRPAILDQTAMALVGRELGLLARAQNSSLKADLPNFAEDEVPNPMGGPPIRSRITYALDGSDPAAGRARISWTTALDPESVRGSMVELAERAGPGPEARDELSKAEVTDARTCHADIDMPTGLAVKVECVAQVRVTVGGKTQASTDRWTITQTLPGTP